MYNLLISIAASLVAFFAAGFGFSGGKLNVWYGILPLVITLTVVYLLLARRSFKQMEAIALKAQKVFEGRQIEKGIEILESARPLGKWQFFIESQLDAQIGSVYFLTKDFKKAEPFLKKGYIKNWYAQTQLGVLYFKHRDYDKMEATFEEACESNKKQPLLWNVYAYCQWERHLKDDAISILSRFVEHVTDDNKTNANLLALQNNRRMKMRGWDMMWYQLHLDRPPTPDLSQYQQQQTFRR